MAIWFVIFMGMFSQIESLPIIKNGDTVSDYCLPSLNLFNLDGVTFSFCKFKGTLQLFGCTNILIKNCVALDIVGQNYIRVRDRCDSVVIDGCVFYRSKVKTEEIAIQLKGTNQNCIVRRNTFINLTDAVQATPNINESNNVDNLLIDSNLMICRPEYQGYAENAIDIKVPATSQANKVIIRNNIMQGFRPTIPGYPTIGSDGAAILCHVGAKNITIESNNQISDNTYSLKVEQLLENGSYVDRGIYYNGSLVNMAGKNTTTYIG